jgi:hypothetical protein
LPSRHYTQGLRCGSVVECLPSMYKVLGSIHSNMHTQKDYTHTHILIHVLPQTAQEEENLGIYVQLYVTESVEETAEN